MDRNEANSRYDSLQTELRGKVHDVSLQIGYTYSRAFDSTMGTGGDGFDLDTITNPYAGWKYDWGPSIFDRNHVAFVNFICDVPFFRDSPSRLLKNTIGSCQES